MEKYAATYVRCTRCGAVTVSEPHWLEEAYNQPINDEDAGLLARCARLTTRTAAVIRAEGIGDGRFLDWGGGYGTLTRMMRDRGYAYFHDDPYTQNLFAREFPDEPGTRYDLISAFEVLEHLTYPSAELTAIAERTDRVLVSTALLPAPAPAPEDWWYYGLDHGQHITLHTEDSLRVVARTLGFELTTNGLDIHLFHREPLTLLTRTILSQQLRATRAAVARTIGRLRPGRSG
jgi:hypothetical protein